MILYFRPTSPSMAFATKVWMSSGVRAAGLNASLIAAGTAGSSVTRRGAAFVFTAGVGDDMNTGRFVSEFVGRIEGDKGLDCSALGVVVLGGELAGNAGVSGVLRVDMEDMEAWWWIR